MSDETRAQSLRVATINGLKLEYELRGTGEPIALIHLSLYADSFAPLMDQPALAGHKLLRYHRRGYAGSSRTAGPVSIADQAADLAGLLDNLEIRRAHVVGHSYGGLIALQLALDRPDLVGTIVLMESALRVRSGGPASQDLSRRMAVGFQRYREGDREGAADGFLTPVFGPGYRQILDQLLPGSWEQAVKDADMFFGIEVPELQRWQFGPTEATRITVPVLSMVGGQSDPAFIEMEELLRELLPNLETVRIPKTNHLLCLQEPQPVAEALARFFAKHQLT
jgi:pimeloyl-ACP methyl ester carboxylesterase